MGDLPAKLFFRIGEVAGLVGVEPHVLRYWEREFRSIRPTKSAKGQRVYSRKDVENLLRVRDLLYRDGFTIAGAKKKLQRLDEHGGSLEGAAAQRVAVATAGTNRNDDDDDDDEVVRASSSYTHTHARAHHSADDALSFAHTKSTWKLDALHDEHDGEPSGITAREELRSSHVNEKARDDRLSDEQPRVREKLVALRSEIEAFLAELSPPPNRR